MSIKVLRVSSSRHNSHYERLKAIVNLCIMYHDIICLIGLSNKNLMDKKKHAKNGLIYTRYSDIMSKDQNVGPNPIEE